jgi:hypothetical protein
MIAGPVGASLSSSSSLSDVLSVELLEEDAENSMKTGWCVQRAML